MDKTKKLDHGVELFKNTLGFQGVTAKQLEQIAGMAFEQSFAKGEIIFHQSEKCEFFHVVADGLVKVSMCSASGNRMTYLLATRGEPLNLVGPFTGSPRLITAEAFNDVTILSVPREDFLSFVFKYQSIIINMISMLGFSIDASNGRMIDMLEKRVEERLLKVLYTLHEKFGPELKFTSYDLAELAGTTAESALRAMAS